MKFEAVKKQLESQEMEVMEARLMKTSELNGELDDDNDAGQCSCGTASCRRGVLSVPQSKKKKILGFRAILQL